VNTATIAPTPQPCEPGVILHHVVADYPANQVDHIFIYAVQDASQLTFIVNTPGVGLQTFPASEMLAVERRKVSRRP